MSKGEVEKLMNLAQERAKNSHGNATKRCYTGVSSDDQTQPTVPGLNLGATVQALAVEIKSILYKETAQTQEKQMLTKAPR